MRMRTRIPVRIGVCLSGLLGLLATPAAASPFGTQYSATVTNLPGTATATLSFDGLEEPLGSSGLVVGETATSFDGFELVEFSLRTADGESFVGQQGAPTDPASVLVTDLHWLGDPTPASALARSAFLWLSIDGQAQALSDVLGRGLAFGTHPLDPSIPVVFIENGSSALLAFDTSARSAAEAFAALVGPTLAEEIDDLHFGMAVTLMPEPAAGLALGFGLLAVLALRRASRR